VLSSSMNYRLQLRIADPILTHSAPYILTSLLPYLLFRPSRDEKPVTATPLESVVTNCDVRNPFRIRFYEKCRVASIFATPIEEQNEPHSH
jgi:hypothetical protein